MQIFTPRPRLMRDTALADASAAALLDRLRDIKRRDFDHALWVGAGNMDALAAIKTIGTIDIRETPVEDPIEHFPFDAESLDLIIVNGTLNVVNDLPGVLIQMRRALKPDGLFLCAIAGGETLMELRDATMRVESRTGKTSPRVHPMIDLQTFAGLMQRAGFTLPVADAEIKIVHYRALKTLLRDIKRMGEGLSLSARSRAYVGKHFWNDVEADYKATHADADGLLRASIEIIYAIGWGPAATQQQPLKPGAAQHRLADALGGTEISLPDRATPGSRGPH